MQIWVHSLKIKAYSTKSDIKNHFQFMHFQLVLFYYFYAKNKYVDFFSLSKLLIPPSA